MSFIQDSLNFSFHQSTNEIPYELHYGKSVQDKIYQLFPLLERRPIDRKFQLELANEKLRASFEKRAKAQGSESKIEIKKGDLVLVRVSHLSDSSKRQIHKFFHLYEGPFRIDEQNGNACVLVDVSNPEIIKGTYNRCFLRKYHCRTDALQSIG